MASQILEFDIEIKLTKLIRGQGLAHLMASNCKALNLSLIDSNIPQVNEKIRPYPYLFESQWYRDIVYFLQNLTCMPEMEKSKKRALKLKAIKYCIIGQELYWKDSSRLLLKCLDEDESQRVIAEMHKGAYGGHLYWKSRANKILRAGYYWPTMFLDVYKKVRACLECQKFAIKEKLHSLPLKPISIEAPFQQWGLDSIGEIHPPSKGQHKWILTATDYFMKWIKVVPVRNAIDIVIIKFLT